MSPLSESAIRLRDHLHELDFPDRLWEQFNAGGLTVVDLRELLPQAWMYREAPEQIIGSTKWVVMFRAACYLVVPTNLPDLPTPLRLFRGATAERKRGMAWYLHREHADDMRQRHERYGPVSTYTTEASRNALLGFFERPGDGPEVVLDPQVLGDVYSAPALASD